MLLMSNRDDHASAQQVLVVLSCPVSCILSVPRVLLELHGERARTLGLEGSAQPTGDLTLLLCCRIGPCVDCTPAGTPTPQHPQRRDAFYPPYGALDCQLLVFLG